MKKYKLKISTVFIISWFLFSLFACTGRMHDDAGCVIENGAIRFRFDDSTGALLAMTDLNRSLEMLQDSNGQLSSPWEITLEKGGVTQKLDIHQAGTFHVSQGDNHSATLEWNNFSGIANPSLKVSVHIELDGDQALSKWHLSVSGMQGEKLTKVTLPKIDGLKDMGDEALAVPSWMGELIKNPRGSGTKPRTYAWNYPGPLSMQMIALYNKQTHGFYAAADDSLSYVKQFSFFLDSLNHLSYGLNNYPATDTTLTTYQLPYGAVVGIFQGDWLSAATIYGKWATRQSWCRQSRFRNRTDSSWAEQTALWVWNRGRSSNVLSPAVALKNKLGLPVNVLWHWWHGCAYDDGFPEYFPPREGSESFKAAVAKANKEGVKAIVYMNSFQWGTSTQSFKKEDAQRWAVRDAQGNTRAHVFNIFTHHSLTPMCMATDFWRNKYAALADQAINEYHTGGVYMDQACLNLMCYNKDHGHTIGGGNYWVKSFGSLTRQIRSHDRVQDRTVLAGEGCGESWLPYLDALLTLQVSKERYAGVGSSGTIPLFQAVYHQYGISFGSYSSLVSPPYDELWPKEDAPQKQEQLLDARFNEQFLMEQARSFVWGMQPTIANYHEFLSSQRTEEINYLIDLVKTRYKTLDYLLYGKFVRAPAMDIPEKNIPISRLSIYAGQKDRVSTFQEKVPLLYTSAWKADNGSMAIALASISAGSLPVNMTFKADEYALPASGKVFVIDAKGKKHLLDYQQGQIKIDLTLPGRGICVLQITDAHSG